MQAFLTAAFGAFAGAVAGFVSAVLMAQRATRTTNTNGLIAEFFSDAFLAHRICIADLWRKVEAGDVETDDIAPGFWHPGRAAY